MSDQRFNTGNPIGSNSPLDRSDNTRNLDLAVNSEDPQWIDRFGRPRLPLMEQERQFVASQDSRDDQFQSDQSSRDDQFHSAQSYREAVFSDFLQASGYQDLGEYAPGIEITTHNQYVTFGGQPYTLKPSVPVPYTTSGEWTGDDFKLIGDGSLRQDLANPDKGAAMVARGVVAVDSVADLLALPEGQRKPGLRYLVSSYYGKDYPYPDGFAVMVPYVGPSGGGQFYYDADRVSESDGGTVFNGFVRVRTNTIDVDWFGIIRGDYEADQYSRFSSFITAIKDGDKVTMRGGFKAVLPSALSLTKNDLEVVSDNQPILLPYSPAMSAANAGAAIAIRSKRSKYSLVCFDGHRKSNGPGTAETPPGTGQGGLVMIGGDYEGTVFDRCTFQYSIYPGVVTGSYAENLKFYKCKWPNSGEHHVYLSAGYSDIDFDECFWGNNGMNPDQGSRLCTDIKIRSLVGFPRNLRIRNGHKNQSEVVEGMMHGVLQSTQGSFTGLEVDGLVFENTQNIYQGLMAALALAPGERAEDMQFKRVRNGPKPMGNLLSLGDQSSNDRLLKGLSIEDYEVAEGIGVSLLFAFDTIKGLRVNNGIVSTANSQLTNLYRCEGPSDITDLHQKMDGSITPMRICPSFRSANISGSVRLTAASSVSSLSLVYDETANARPSDTVKLDLSGLDLIAGDGTSSHSLQFGGTSASRCKVKASGTWDRRFGFVAASEGIYDVDLDRLDMVTDGVIVSPDRARSIRSSNCSNNISWSGLVTVPSGSLSVSVATDPILAYDVSVSDVVATPCAGSPGSWYTNSAGRGTIRVYLEESKPHDVVFSVKVDLDR